MVSRPHAIFATTVSARTTVALAVSSRFSTVNPATTAVHQLRPAARTWSGSSVHGASGFTSHAFAAVWFTTRSFQHRWRTCRRGSVLTRRLRRSSISPQRQTGSFGRESVSNRPNQALERTATPARVHISRSEEHTSELQSLTNLVCRLLLE